MTMTVTQAVITMGIVIAGTVFTRFIAYIAFPEGKKMITYNKFRKFN